MDAANSVARLKSRAMGKDGRWREVADFSH